MSGNFRIWPDLRPSGAGRGRGHRSSRARPCRRWRRTAGRARRRIGRSQACRESATVTEPRRSPLTTARGSCDITLRGHALRLGHDPVGLGGGAARERRSVAKLEQDLAAAMRSQRSCERFFELLERVDMLHCGVERSISYEVAQLLVNLLDLCPGRVAYPIHEPESVEAEITIDQVFGRDRRELPAQNGVDDSRAASLERPGQLAHRSSAYVIEDEAQFLPVQSLLNILV